MGIYTNGSGYVSGYGYNTDYTKVAPFVGEHFNYHELGILAAAEISENNNSFMKAIALSELAAVEQTGSTDVLYESVNIKGIFEKIRMFFKKIIDKINKIFHTFIAKLSSWFGDTKAFAKKYSTEITKKWADIKDDWEYEGYKFSHINTAKFDTTVTLEVDTGLFVGSEINKYIDAIKNGTLKALIDKVGTNDADFGPYKNAGENIRKNLDTVKEYVRGSIINAIANNTPLTDIDVSDTSKKIDSDEYQSELFKAFRSNEDSKGSIAKKDLLEQYGGSVNSMIGYLKDYDSIKKKIEKNQKDVTTQIDKLIKAIDRLENELLRDTKDDTTKTKRNEVIVQYAALYQGIYGFVSEALTTAFSALLQAQKDACAQAKEICVKVIGLSKKMTESYDYDSSYSGNYNFFDSVKLV